MTDRPYATWPMKVGIGSYAGTDTRVGRTGPARLSDVVNVVDWGAVGVGSSSQTAKIQAAINFCISRGGGTVFFPSGNYAIGTEEFLTVGSNDPDIKVRLLGSSGGAQAGASNINSASGYSTGFLISKGTGNTYDSLSSIEHLTVTNGTGAHGSGAVKFVGSGASFRNCTFGGLVGLDLSAADGCTVMACLGYGQDGNSAADGTYTRSLYGIGFYLGNRCLATNCRLNGSYFIGYALSGYGAAVVSCGVESVNIGCRIGWAPGGSDSGQESEAIACTVQGLGTEKCWTALDVYFATGCTIQNCIFIASGGQPNPQAINAASTSWSAGTVTVTTSGNHNLSAGVHNLEVDIGVNAGNGTNASPNPWRPTAFTPCTSAGPATNTFTYPLAADPGAASKGTGLNAPAWTYPVEYALRVRKATDCAFNSLELNSNAVIAAGDLDYGGSATHSNNVMTATIGGRGWIPPTGNNRASWKFISVGKLVPDTDSIATAGNPCATMTFSNLPGQTGVLQPGPFETQEFDITDGCKSLGPEVAAGFADIVIGGGSTTGNHYKVRYDGANWRRVG